VCFIGGGRRRIILKVTAELQCEIFPDVIEIQIFSHYYVSADDAARLPSALRLDSTELIEVRLEESSPQAAPPDHYFFINQTFGQVSVSH
jgi:hypothetical protein